MNKTSISYADFTWNPLLGCDRISPGCDNCYAERLASTRLAHLQDYQGLTTNGKWNGTIRLLSERLREPLKRKKPAVIFVGDMGDLFHHRIPFEWIAAVFGVMAACSKHTFLTLTKRPERMVEFCEWIVSRGHFWPLPNWWAGVTVEDQQQANKRIPLLLQTPAAHRWVSFEPLLEQVDADIGGIDQAVIGGESGPKARQCNVEWIRSLRDQCRDAGTKCYVKQIGSNAVADTQVEVDHWQVKPWCTDDRHGADPSEWPEDLRVRELGWKQ